MISRGKSVSAQEEYSSWNRFQAFGRKDETQTFREGKWETIKSIKSVSEWSCSNLLSLFLLLLLLVLSTIHTCPPTDFPWAFGWLCELSQIGLFSCNGTSHERRHTCCTGSKLAFTLASAPTRVQSHRPLFSYISVFTALDVRLAPSMSEYQLSCICLFDSCWLCLCVHTVKCVWMLHSLLGV